MLYTEKFKKEVVKKALSPGVIQTDMCRKLGISKNSLSSWKKKYRSEVEDEIPEINVAEILREEEVDIDRMLYEAEARESCTREESAPETIDSIFSSHIKRSEFKTREKYLILSAYRKLQGNEKGVFLRRYGLHSRELTLWEEEILEMGKRKIDKDEYIKKLESERKSLLKQVKNLERDKKELEIIVELKKKYPRIFGEDEES